ncbi:hypothetical protein CerSpe_075760 [Prunus speciosa]
MEAISFGDTRVPFPLSIRPEGNIIIDSGTTLTILPEDTCTQIWKMKSRDTAPSMTVHFHGVDVKLESRNTFLRHNEEIVCFAFAPDGYYGTYGNLAQMNFLVGYDLQKHTVSFKPTDCTKLHQSLV